MCGALIVPYHPTDETVRSSLSSVEDLRAYAQAGEIRCAFWDRHPLLPVREGEHIRFYDWGNRDGKLDLPKTGWARWESLQAGKWNHLKPQFVRIPASKGCDKKVWFDVHQDIQGVLVEWRGEKRVYLVTEAATSEYQQLTGHDRMPKFFNEGG